MILKDFIYDGYKGKFSHEEIGWLLLAYEDRIVVIKEDGIKGVALYFKVSDETIKNIEELKIDLTNHTNVNRCLAENGDNVHFFLLAADGVKTILKGLKMVIEKENPKTISWFSPDMKQFFIRRKILCLQS